MNWEECVVEAKRSASVTTRVWRDTREVVPLEEEPTACVGKNSEIYSCGALDNSDTCEKCVSEDSEYIDTTE